MLKNNLILVCYKITPNIYHYFYPKIGQMYVIFAEFQDEESYKSHFILEEYPIRIDINSRIAGLRTDFIPLESVSKLMKKLYKI